MPLSKLGSLVVAVAVAVVAGGGAVSNFYSRRELERKDTQTHIGRERKKKRERPLVF